MALRRCASMELRRSIASADGNVHERHRQQKCGSAHGIEASNAARASAKCEAFHELTHRLPQCSGDGPRGAERKAGEGFVLRKPPEGTPYRRSKDLLAVTRGVTAPCVW